MEANLFEGGIKDRFIEAVNGVPGAHIDPNDIVPAFVPYIDAMVDLDVRGERTLLMLEARKRVFPQDIERAIGRLKKFRDIQPPFGQSLFVLLAETISPGAKSQLQAENIGYYDSSGSLFLPAPGAHIFIDRPPSKKQAKALGSVFDGRKAEVIEALWEQRQAWSNVKTVAGRIGAATSFVSSTFQGLEQHGWVDVQGQGPAKVRRLKNWDELLDAWTDHARRREPPMYARFYVQGKPREIIEAISRECQALDLPYEITGEIAANIHASVFTATPVVRCRMLPDRRGNEVLDRIGARAVGEGWNLGVLSGGPTEFGFRENRDGTYFASPLRTYLDLQRTGGRGKDGAKLLREQRLTLDERQA